MSREKKKRNISNLIDSAPSYVNDTIVSAVLYHIAHEAKSIGVAAKVFDTNLAGQLWQIQHDHMAALDKTNQSERLLRRLKDIDMEGIEVFVFPQHIDKCHWIVTIVSQCNRNTRRVTT